MRALPVATGLALVLATLAGLLSEQDVARIRWYAFGGGVAQDHPAEAAQVDSDRRAAVPEDEAREAEAQDLRRRAEQGEPEAQYRFGVHVVTRHHAAAADRIVAARARGEVAMGLGEPDYAEAVRWYRLAAEQGFPPAQVRLGYAYAEGQGVPQDDAEAVRWYRLAVEQGYGQYGLSQMYYAGRGGLPRDYRAAVRYLRLAAEQGHESAQVKLGAMYTWGLGVPRDDAEAERWFQRVNSESRPDGDAAFLALIGYGFMERQDYAEAARWYRLGIERSSLGAFEHDAIELARRYYEGDGVPQDRAEAMWWFRFVAEQGNARAQLRLGMMHMTGDDVPQDDAEAVRWFRLSADQGNAGAYFGLGVMYADGVSGPPSAEDLAEAVRWYRLAAEAGVEEAQREWVGVQYNLGVRYATGDGVPQDDAEAVRLFQLSADQGLALAQLQLGVRYLDGSGGVPEDYVIAHMWLNLAAAQGDEDARKLRALAAAKMTPAQIAEAQRLAREWTPAPERDPALPAPPP